MTESVLLLALPEPGFHWRVEDGNLHHVLSVHGTKPDALQFAKEIIRRSGLPGTLRIHDVHGHFREEHRYGVPHEKRERVMVGDALG